MDGNRAVKKAVRIRDHNLQWATHPPLLESVRTSISPGAFDHLLQEWTEAMRTRATREASTAPTEPARYHVHTGVLCADRAVVATKRTCSARCERNNGLLCRHILRVYMAENSEELDDQLIHPFWREEKGSEDDSEDDDENHDAQGLRPKGSSFAPFPDFSPDKKKTNYLYSNMWVFLAARMLHFSLESRQVGGDYKFSHFFLFLDKILVFF